MTDRELDDDIARAAALCNDAKRIAVLTGAGISAESGLSTFRGAGGLWEGHRVEEVATPFAFERDPELVWRFYNMRRDGLAKVKPNPGHDALVALENLNGVEQFTLITQNVDGLHRAAGSQRVLELHGNLRRVRCTNRSCDYRADRGTETLDDMPTCEQCNELLRPDIVWFHESLPAGVWMDAEMAVKRCQVFLVVGTSAVVYPAAGLIHIAKDHGARVIEVNLEATEATSIVDVGLMGKSGIILPALITKLSIPQ